MNRRAPTPPPRVPPLVRRGVVAATVSLGLSGTAAGCGGQVMSTSSQGPTPSPAQNAVDLGADGSAGATPATDSDASPNSLAAGGPATADADVAGNAVNTDANAIDANAPDASGQSQQPPLPPQLPPPPPPPLPPPLPPR